MAKRAVPPPPKEVRYVRHTNRPEWGVGVLVAEDGDRATYLFADGQKRQFKTDLSVGFIQPAEPPTEENKARLERGLATGGVATPKAINLDLEAKILEAPDDPDAWVVYADWLLQQNDPRGHLVAVQTEILRDPKSTKLRTAEKKLFDTHGEYLLPQKLWGVLRLPKQKPDNPRTRSDVVWKYGFIERVRLAKRPRQQAELPEILTELCRHPSARFLRAIAVGDLGTSQYSYVGCVEAIVNARHPLVEDVFIGDFDPGSTTFESSRAGNLSGLLSSLPNLKKLTVRAGTARFESALKHEKLAGLRLVLAGLGQGMLDRLASAKNALPALRRLELECDTLIRPREDVLSELRRGFGNQLEVLEVKGSSELSADAARRIVAGADALITEQEITARAPDLASMEAARNIARPNMWQIMAREGDRVWGQHQGGSGSYSVLATLSDESIASCSCPSPKDPCKHVLALLLLAADGAAFAEMAVPDRLLRQSETARRRYRPSYE